MDFKFEMPEKRFWFYVKLIYIVFTVLYCLLGLGALCVAVFIANTFMLRLINVLIGFFFLARFIEKLHKSTYQAWVKYIDEQIRPDCNFTDKD